MGEEARNTEGRQRALRLLADVNITKVAWMTPEKAYLQGVRDATMVMTLGVEQLSELLSETVMKQGK